MFGVYVIDWNQTFIKFGTDEKTTKLKSRVVVNCSVCNSVSDRVLKSVKQTIKRKGLYKCHKCSTNSTEFKEGCSERAMEKWQDPEYIENNLTVVRSDEYRNQRKVESTERWLDDEYRSKMMTPEMTEIRRNNSSVSARKLWLRSEYREKLTKSISDRMILLWEDDGYRERMKISQTEITKQLWANNAFRDCFGDDFSEKMKPINKEISSRPEVKIKLLIASKKKWANREYRDIVSKISKDRWLDDEYRKKMAIARANQPRISSIQLSLYKYLDTLGIDYHKEGTETAIGYYAFDCLVPKNGTMKKSILIECQGDYWHSLSSMIVKDKAKFTYINRYFPEYEIMYVWEHEFYTDNRVLDRLKLKLGLDIKRVDFNFKDVNIKLAITSDLKPFLDAYHYIGKGRGGVSYGAYYENELIACVVYSPPLRQNMDSFGEFRELSRFCIHPSYHKKNFGSWFIGKTLKLVGGRVVSYADTTVGHAGTIYKASNFKLHHEVEPDYWYVDFDGYVMHKRTLYGRAVKMGMSEGDFAVKFGYLKKFGGKKLCFVYG